MRGLRQAGLALMIALALGGCAINRVRVERGAELVKAGEPVVAQSNRLLDQVAATSREAQLEFAAIDPSCDWPEVIIGNPPPPPAPGKPRPICVDAGTPGAFRVEPIQRAQMGATIALIGALGDYIAAVDAVVAEDPVDLAAAVGSARATLDGVAGDVATIANRPKPAFLTDDQWKALGALAGFVGELAQEADQVRRLKAIERQAPDVRRITAQLRTDLQQWSLLGLESDLSNIQTLYTVQWQALRRAGSTESERRELLARRVAVMDRLSAAKALPVQLGRVIDAFDAAHGEYVNALENTELSEANRRRLAEVARERLRRTLSIVADTLAAFR